MLMSSLPVADVSTEPLVPWLSACRQVFPDLAEPAVLRSSPAGAFALTPGPLQPVIAAVRPGERVAVIVSDHTRKTAVDQVLPRVWAGWRERGVCRPDLTVVVACGSHRGPTPVELAAILGPELDAEFRDQVVIHDAFHTPCVRLGVTRRGTPVEIAEGVVRADAVVTFGGVVFHYFAGFTGGRKSVLPGVASARTIAANHSLSVDVPRSTIRPEVEIGRLAGNPVAEDMAEGAAFVPVRATVQTVLAADGRLAGVFAGGLADAHAAACDLAARLFSCPLRAPADLVVAWAGPARNWLQSHKALVNASRAVSANGVVVLLADCSEGLGSASLARWLDKESPEAIVRGIAESADINSQTALSTRVRGRHAILVSRLAAADLARTGMAGAASLNEALQQARQRLATAGIERPSLAFMPEAWLTVPTVAAPDAGQGRV